MCSEVAVRPKCFVICPIGEEGTETRRRSDQVLKHIIRPSVEACGYEAIRADEIDKPGLITSQVIQHVVTDPLVVADLTETNPNVFYELAIRHAIKRPLVQIIQKGERIPFDIAGTRTIHVDHQDLDSVASAREDIGRQIKELEADPNSIETPISVSLEIQSLRESENPNDRNLAEVVSELTEIRGGLDKILSNQKNFAVPEIIDRFERLEYKLGDNLRGGMLRPDMRHRSKEYMHFLHEIPRDQSPAISIAILASIFKEFAPWLFEIGMEAYREVSRGNSARAKKSIKRFHDTLMTTLNHPFMRRRYGNDTGITELSEELMYRIMIESEHLDENNL
jgi:uncharacterized protein (DUF983 family)